jgi:squalene-hopene/tetraprenyl-beta-curcumene cyclase
MMGVCQKPHHRLSRACLFVHLPEERFSMKRFAGSPLNSTRNWSLVTFVGLSITAALSVTCAIAADAKPQAGTVGPDAKLLEQTRQQAVNFLKTSQADDGSWTSPQAPGISALVTTALLQSGVPASDATVARALKHLETFIQEDGGIYFAKSTHRNYETSIALLAFHEANSDGRYDKIISGAEKFLRKLQWDEDEGLKETDTAFGGAGYGSHERPDLSNTQFLLEALKAAGVKSNDPAMQKALLFVSRCQNLETEHNNTPFAAKVNDGGFYYTPAAGGTSQAGLTKEGGLRSYGSMTYAGLKSMIYAGLDRDDQRVKAAVTWIRKFYSVSENPGMGQQGLYYYYHTFAKALATLEVDLFQDAAGDKHDWRKELAGHLASQQKPNGSWVNEAPRWSEGDPNLVTAYALLALKHCEPKTASPSSKND